MYFNKQNHVKFENSDFLKKMLFQVNVFENVFVTWQTFCKGLTIEGSMQLCDTFFITTDLH